MKANIEVSPVTTVRVLGNEPHFQVKQLGMSAVGQLSSPVLNIDHYLTTERKFDAHPHAGFSAVTYVFDSSKGSIRNRDSKGDDTLIGPGDLHWTLAGSGIIHDEAPEPRGVPAEGIQLFVNLSPKSKKQDSRVYKLSSASAPRVPVQGGSVKVVTGQFSVVKSPVQLDERFDLLDIRLEPRGEVKLEAFANSGGLIYVLEGAVTVSVGGTERQLKSGEYVAIHVGNSSSQIEVKASSDAKLLSLRGEYDEAPIVSHGPFIMNNKEDILNTIQRYQTGKMGRL